MPQKNRFKVAGKDLVETVRQLVRRGDARRICLLSEEKHLLDVPISVGDPSAPAAALEGPVLAALRAFGSLVGECTIEVEK